MFKTEKEFLKAYNPNDYKQLSMTTDILIMSVSTEENDNYRKLEEKKFSMQNKQPMFLDNWDVGTELYALTNIDYKDSSCQNRVMLNQYFEDQLYLRWTEIGYSTIYSVTNHSMICLTGDRKYVTAPVVNPFLIEYIQLCILVLAQRASLIAFDSRITEAISREGRT